MKRPKRFLILILILLVINSVFFIAWYGFDLQNVVKNIAAKELGKALKGNASIKDLKLSERQILAKGINFQARDGSMAFRVDHIRVRYNLLKFIFSGFRIKYALDQVDIERPYFRYTYHARKAGPKRYKYSPPFRIPDLSRYFNDISVHNGIVRGELVMGLKIVTPDSLRIAEELNNLSIEAHNGRNTSLKLQANSSSKGLVKANLVLHKGSLIEGRAELSNFSPIYAYHPDLKNFSTDLNIAVTAKQENAKAPITFDAQAFLWNTEALFMDKYPLSLPYVSAFTDGKDLTAEIAQSSIGSSQVEGSAQLSDLFTKPSVVGSLRFASLDLAMLEQGVEGSVQAELVASGYLSDPTANLRLSSQSIRYQGMELTNLEVKADYKDKIAVYEIISAAVGNQQLTAAGTFDTRFLSLDGTLQTQAMESFGQPLTASGEITYQANFNNKYPQALVLLNNFDFNYQLLELTGLNGFVQLVPAEDNYYAQASISGDQGFHLEAVGEILERAGVLDADFSDVKAANIYAQQSLIELNPAVSGKLKAYIDGDQITLNTNLNLQLSLPETFDYSTELGIMGTYNLNSGDAELNLFTENGLFNGEVLDIALLAEKEAERITVYNLRVNQLLSLSGDYNLKNSSDLSFDLSLRNLNSELIQLYLPQMELNLPEISGLSLTALYNQAKNRDLNVQLFLDKFKVEGLNPLSTEFSINGTLDNCALEGHISNLTRSLIEITGDASIGDKISLNAKARLDNVQPQDLMWNPPFSASLNGSISAEFSDLLTELSNPLLGVDLHLKDLELEGFAMDYADVVIEQKKDILLVDVLSAGKEGLFTLTGSGALDYNILANRFYEGDHKLQFAVTGELFDWLDQSLDYITKAGGKSTLSAEIGTQEEQFMITTGKLEIVDGSVELQDQPETLKNINIDARFENNRFIIDSGSMKMGKGKINLSNIFQEDEGNHFQVAFLDLGIFQISISDPGALVYVPLFTPPRSLSNLSLKGQDGPFATIMGPFDDMKIMAEATVSNASAVYPPNTDDLLKLIYSVRDAASKKQVAEAAPLPFRLDLMLHLEENVRYVTYPTNMKINPGSYLHLIYDGLTWSLSEANFSVESGTIDFFGTVFEAETMTITMLESQQVMLIQGTFIKRAPDGSTITLGINTDRDTSKPFLDRLQFNLTSDNPDDRSISDILARMRYSNKGGEVGAENNENQLSDDALNLIGGNLNASLLSPILYPVENTLRRFLRLDAFSINVGFIQNLFTEYTSDPNQLAGYTDMKQFNNDIMQFSSSILLNNLSISMSKYLVGRLFLDYKFTLQEATDLQKNTVMLIAHDTSLRMKLPWKLRIAYNLKYEPDKTSFTHGVMLQRSFRF